MNLGANIRKIREFRGIKQQHIADKMNLSITSYGKIERDEIEITLKRLNEISQILNVPIVTIINLTDDIFSERQAVNNYEVASTVEVYFLKERNRELMEEKGKLLLLLEKALSDS
ncbi:helix-turn-helix domain-containing protein [Pedobacter kyungheensis]|uniref:helix-turn-helix domain-containing protein n=1 Tax=Pedobacter kyungheensis TaxID=1069985 RepID=UPI000689754C|nr:helix-turn-helix transcriptional regulator [Pedobacter kyungheensis]